VSTPGGDHMQGTPRKRRADITSNTYYDWLLDNAAIVLASSFLVSQCAECERARACFRAHVRLA
jgi:hypothetical protein